MVYSGETSQKVEWMDDLLHLSPDGEYPLSFVRSIWLVIFRERDCTQLAIHQAAQDALRVSQVSYGDLQEAKGSRCFKRKSFKC